MATVDDIVKAVEAIAPAGLAEEWDNVGLQLGSRTWKVARAVTALDPTPAVVDDIIKRKADVLVTHHPLIFRPLRRLDLDTPLGGVLQQLMANRIAVVSAHTNLDSVTGGVNDVLAAALGLAPVAVLQSHAAHPECGLGRIGNLPLPVTLHALAVTAKERLAIPQVRCVGDLNRRVQRVAICSGSGSSLLKAFFSSGAEVFITGDAGYHDAREVEARGRGLIDIGHFESEHIVLESLARQLAGQLETQGLDIPVETCSVEQTPFATI
jgi:dinuclear metal center YbgI/SA1388 family protein